MSEEFFDKSKDNQIRQNGLIMTIDEVVDLLNSQSDALLSYDKLVSDLKKENEKLKKQLEIRTASDKYHQRMLTKWLCKNE